MKPVVTHSFLRHGNPVILMLAAMLCLTSCMFSSNYPSSFDANIRTAEDVKQLKMLDDRHAREGGVAS